jgi:hypothetical protein
MSNLKYILLCLYFLICVMIFGLGVSALFIAFLLAEVWIGITGGFLILLGVALTYIIYMLKPEDEPL